MKPKTSFQRKGAKGKPEGRRALEIQRPKLPGKKPFSAFLRPLCASALKNRGVTGFSMMRPGRLALLAAAFALSGSALAELSLKDDTGQEIRLKAPAKRIVALAPHIAESLFAAGAGDKLVGTVEYSDYPPEAKQVPRVGGYSRVDLEAVAALKPDLVLAWESGNNMPQISKLRALGLSVYVSQPNKMENVADQLERLGQRAGSEAVARPAAERFRQRLEALRKANAGKPKVRTFYQIWRQPLMTVGGGQVISDAIRLCSGENVFADLKPLAPKVTVEAVLAADPEAIVASGMGESRPEWLDDWRHWKTMTAVKRDNLFFVQPDLIQRHTPRLCAHLETARSRR